MGSKIFCDSDFVEFVEETSGGKTESIKRFCGGDEPAIYVSSKSKLQIHYIQTQNFPGTGWVLNFMGVHEGKTSN